MNKLTAAIGTLIVVALLAAACGGDGGNSATPDETLSATPIDDLSAFLLTLEDIDSFWTSGPPLDRSGYGPYLRNNLLRPPVCAVLPESRESSQHAEAGFIFDAFESHGPFLYQAIAQYPPGQAQLLMDNVISIAESCPPEIVLTAGQFLVNEPRVGPTPAGGRSLSELTWIFSRLPLPSLGDQSVAFKRGIRTTNTNTDIDTILIRQGDVISFLYHMSPIETDADITEAVARTAAEKVRRLVEGPDNGDVLPQD